MKPNEKILILAKSALAPSEVFHIDLRPEWGSENPNYRTEIRKGILEYLKAHHPDQVANSVWDLEAPPMLKSLFVSISHTEGMGGFTLCSKTVGLDIENTSRITQKIIDRVSTEDELKACPKFELLWPAKEAVFKSTTEFYTISHIHLVNWSKSQNDTYAFNCLTAHGWAFNESNHSYAIAIKKT